MSPDRPVTRQTRVTRLTKLTNKTDQTIREGRCKNCQQCKIANLQTRQTRVTRLTRLTRLTRQYERGGARIFKHGKLPISSFVQPVSQSHTIISATDAGASENDFSDTIETKAVVVISLDSPANRPQKPKKDELRFVRSHLGPNTPLSEICRCAEMLVFDKTTTNDREN